MAAKQNNIKSQSLIM